ncbi:transposase [Pelagibacterium nitratireducens]|uniref:Transposase n=1 Tax=Pelagibacterium nitratireducens TaxID=1046114 RepID=A0ABZ2I6X6_9HYPH
MVSRSLEPGTNVSALAREIGISPSQLFGWRAEASGSEALVPSGAPPGHQAEAGQVPAPLHSKS